MLWFFVEFSSFKTLFKINLNKLCVIEDEDYICRKLFLINPNKMKKAIFFASILTALVACEKNENEIESNVDIPSIEEIITGNDFSRTSGAYNNDYIDNYSSLFTGEGESTVSFAGQTTRLKQTKEIGSNLKKTTSVAAIQLMFEGEEVNGSSQSAGFSDASLNGTTKIVRSKTSASIGLFNKTNSAGQGATNVAEFDAYITGHQAVIDNWATPAASGQAGTFLDSDGSTRYVNAKGFELDQLFTKSMAGALAYDQAVNHYFNRLDDENNGSNDYRTANDEGIVKEGSSYTTMEHHWDEAFGYIYGNITGENLIYKYIDNVDAIIPRIGASVTFDKICWNRKRYFRGFCKRTYCNRRKKLFRKRCSNWSFKNKVGTNYCCKSCTLPRRWSKINWNFRRKCSRKSRCFS
jgi:hypothetical protein